MNNTILRQIIPITRMILIVPVTLLTLCAEPTIGQIALSAIQNDFGNSDAHSRSSAPSYSPQVGVGIGELHGQIGRSSRSRNKDLNEQSPACESDAPFVFRIDWIVGRTSIWSIEL